MYDIVKLAAAHISEHPISSMEESRELADRVAAAQATGREMAKEAANPVNPRLVRKWILPGKNPFLPSAMEAAKKKEILKRLGPGYKRALDSGLVRPTKKG